MLPDIFTTIASRPTSPVNFFRVFYLLFRVQAGDSTHNGGAFSKAVARRGRLVRAFRRTHHPPFVLTGRWVTCRAEGRRADERRGEMRSRCGRRDGGTEGKVWSGTGWWRCRRGGRRGDEGERLKAVRNERMRLKRGELTEIRRRVRED